MGLGTARNSFTSGNVGQAACMAMQELGWMSVKRQGNSEIGDRHGPNNRSTSHWEVFEV